MPSPDVLRARLLLLRAAEPPAPAVHHFTAVHGPVEAVARIRNGTAPTAVLGEISRPDVQIEEDLKAIDDGTARLLTPEDDDWPLGRLASLSDHGIPLALWLRGNTSLAALTKTAVTITGARASSTYGNTVAMDLARQFADAGATIVNGGSFGVDEAAHHGALAAGGRTIVVLPCGVDRAHPHQHARLFTRVVAQGGLLISEYPIGTLPTRTRFHSRCRLLAALTAATVVVEAARRGGALTVAHAARDLGRRVCGVPGSIYSVTSKGVHELLHAGVATAASSAEHINYQEGLR